MSVTEMAVAASSVRHVSPRRAAWRRFARNRLAVAAALVLLLLIVVALAAPIISPYNPNAQDLSNALKGPSWTHLLGTDELGRDILSRIFHGARISLLVGITSVLVGLVIALPLGLVSGYYGKVFDLVSQRFIDMMFAFPAFLLALAMAAILGPGLVNMVVAVGVSMIAPMTRLVRSSTLAVRSEEYIVNARTVGCSSARIIFRHVLPNVSAPIIVQATLYIGVAIITAAGLGFLGLGVQPPTAEWGVMLGQGRTYLFSTPHLTIIPGLFIFLTVLSFNYLGDGLRDLLDVRSDAR